MFPCDSPGTLCTWQNKLCRGQLLFSYLDFLFATEKCIPNIQPSVFINSELCHQFCLFIIIIIIIINIFIQDKFISV